MRLGQFPSAPSKSARSRFSATTTRVLCLETAKKRKDLCHFPSCWKMSKERMTLLDRSQETRKIIGPALRALHSFRTRADAGRTWGGLQKTITPDGNILWLCAEHRKQYEAKPLVI